MIPGSRMQLWTFLADRTYQRDIKPVPTLSCGGVFRYRSGERLHGMQEVSGSIPLFSTKKTLHSLCGVFLFARLLVQPDAVNRKIKAEDALPGWKGRLLLFLAVLHARRSRLGRGRVKADEIFRIDPVLWFLF